jgi:hypothetical protein
MKGAAGDDKRQQQSKYTDAPLHNREQSKVTRSLMTNTNHENVSLSYYSEASSPGEGGQTTSTSTRTRSARVAPELEEEARSNNRTNNLSKSRTDNVVVRFAEPLVTDTAFTDRPNASNMSHKDKQSMFYSAQELRVFKIEDAIRREAAMTITNDSTTMSMSSTVSAAAFVTFIVLIEVCVPLQQYSKANY